MMGFVMTKMMMTVMGMRMGMKTMMMKMGMLMSMQVTTMKLTIVRCWWLSFGE